MQPTSRRPCSSASVRSVVSYYRCFLPAVALGADYATWARRREGTEVSSLTGLGAPPAALEDLFDYDVVVLQQPRGVALAEAASASCRPPASPSSTRSTTTCSPRARCKTHELPTTSAPSSSREIELAMRVADGIICSTDYLARRYRRSTRTRGRAATASTSSATRGRKPDARRRARSAGPAASATRRRSRAGSRRSATSCAQRPEARFVSVGHAAAAAYVEEFGPSARSPADRASIEVYPATMTLFDIALAPVGREQPVPRQERPALARGERARHPARRAPGRLPGDRGRRHRRPRAHAGRGRGGAAAARRRPRASASASGRRRTTYVAEHRRIEVAAERWREVLREVARRVAGRRKSSYRSVQRLPITTVSQGRRQQEPYRASPPPPLSQSEVHTGCWRATHTYPTEGRIATGGLL